MRRGDEMRRRGEESGVLTEISQLDVSQDVEAALLDVVDEGDEAHAAARVGHHQQDLGPPELHVVLPHVQHQQVLAHLRQKMSKKKGCWWKFLRKFPSLG